MTDDLSTRLLAAIEDAEAGAKFAFAGHNDAEAIWTEIWSGAVQLGPTEDLLITNDIGVSRHIVRWDPDAVLRLCQAHREIVAEYDGALFAQSCHPGDDRNNGFVIGLSRVLTHLARAYNIEDTPWFRFEVERGKPCLERREFAHGHDEIVRAEVCVLLDGHEGPCDFEREAT